MLELASGAGRSENRVPTLFPDGHDKTRPAALNSAAT